MKYLLATVTVIFLIIIVGVAAFYFGQRTANQSKEMTTTPTPAGQSPLGGADNQQTPTPQEVTGNKKTVEAGGVLSFPNYSLLIPNDWNSQREQGQDSDKLTLIKGGYKIVISEGAFGGSGCLYPGDPPSEMAQTYSKFVQISNPNGFVFRRGSSSDTDTGWTVCQKNSQDGSFGAPTVFGHISITAPQVTDATVMAEIDSIFTSIKKK